MLVKDAMNRRVIVVKPDTTVREAAKVMTKFRIGSLVVMEDDKLVGIITELDIIWKVVANDSDPNTTLVRDVMTKKVITIKPNKSLEDAADLMVHNKIKKLPVVEDHKLVGILTATDLISFEPKLIEGLAKLILFREEKPVAG